MIDESWTDLSDCNGKTSNYYEEKEKDLKKFWLRENKKSFSQSLTVIVGFS